MSKHVGQRCGDYRLTAFLGEGGFAEVYLGEQPFDKGKKAAVKIPRGFLFLDARLLPQFNCPIF